MDWYLLNGNFIKKIFKQHIRENILHVWQFIPVYWAGQEHIYEPVPEFWQVPPFRHGLLKHGLSTKKFKFLKNLTITMIINCFWASLHD